MEDGKTDKKSAVTASGIIKRSGLILRDWR